MENQVLWNRFKIEPNSDTKRQIMSNYTNLVHYVIHNSKFIKLDVIEDKDYFQFGIEGLSEAIDRFDPDYGTKFETYAIQRIRGKIIDELRKLQIKPRQQQTDENSVVYRNVSLDQNLGNEEGFSLTDILPHDDETPDDQFLNAEKIILLKQAIKKLGERDQLLLSLYYYEKLNYMEIAELLGITVSRVCQIHSKIIKELKGYLSTAYAA
ncbi:MAG: sigma-70 family RNA polymerase sigma factor [Melioribacteraceae bacterium]|nr:sigma-70 family RNA polymerase sigma factor [Melioribacteraceae bacterium]MCO6473354.1 sigma-70 family RNA polymerase sigma factor [Melioribacteraceae bacterium]